jgi:hypothetical protein
MRTLTKKAKRGNMPTNLLLKYNFGAWGKADSYVGVVNGSKPSRDRTIKLCGDELVSNLGGSGRDVVQTVVTHGRASDLQCPPTAPLCLTMMAKA